MAELIHTGSECLWINEIELKARKTEIQKSHHAYEPLHQGATCVNNWESESALITYVFVHFVQFSGVFHKYRIANACVHFHQLKMHETVKKITVPTAVLRL